MDGKKLQQSHFRGRLFGLQQGILPSTKLRTSSRISNLAECLIDVQGKLLSAKIFSVHRLLAFARSINTLLHSMLPLSFRQVDQHAIA